MSQLGRDEILDYARRQLRYRPRYVALSVAGTGKWLTLVMDVPCNRLGLEGDARIDVTPIFSST